MPPTRATIVVASLPRLGNNFNVGQQQKLHFIFGSWCVQLVARARACCRHLNECVCVFFYFFLAAAADKSLIRHVRVMGR